MRNASGKKVAEKIKSHVLFSITFSPIIAPFVSSLEKYDRTGQATEENTAHAFCMVDNWGYTHLLSNTSSSPQLLLCERACFVRIAKEGRVAAVTRQGMKLTIACHKAQAPVWCQNTLVAVG